MKKNILKYYLYIFITCSILGFAAEILYSLVIRNKLVHPGTLHGPFCPIYGIGIVLLILVVRNKRSKFLSFLDSFIFASLLEYISAYISEVFFNHKIWDYSNYVLNIQGRVCLVYSLMWAVGGFLIVSYIEPNTYKMYQKYQSKKTDLFFFTLIVLLILDILTKVISGIL